jgi:CRP/FNR family cyclic AMP-dependent transcriptional regulator
MAAKSYLDELAQVPLFSTCTKRELQKIAKASDELKLNAGEVLAEQGSSGREAFVIVEGEAEVSRNGQLVSELGPGAVVGELALLDHGPRTATVTAKSGITVLVLEQRQFWGILDEVPTIAFKMLRTLAGRIRDLDREAYG